VTSPNNPSGLTYDQSQFQRLVEYCRQYDSWLVVDQTYYEFLYEGQQHTIPCSTALQYEKIVHIFSLSKVFGMPGWRVGYVAYPKSLNDSMRKVNK